MAVALFRWCFRDLKIYESVILLVCGLLLMVNRPLILNVVGLVIGLVVVGWTLVSSKKERGKAI
jgi:TRAP-type uncharacterized transport system fused permease subunit